jgi:hypothetical protein
MLARHHLDRFDGFLRPADLVLGSAPTRRRTVGRRMAYTLILGQLGVALLAATAWQFLPLPTFRNWDENRADRTVGALLIFTWSPRPGHYVPLS